MSWDDQIEGQKESIVEDLAKEITKNHPHLFSGTVDPDAIKPIIERYVLSRRDLLPEEREEVKRRLMGQATQYGPLQELFVGPGAEEIAEVMINPSSDGKPKVFAGIHGRPKHLGNHFFENDRELKDYAQKICEDAGREFTESKPFQDAWLGDGSRVSVFGYKASPVGTAMTIRKSPLRRLPVPLSKLIQNGTMPQLAADILTKAVVMGHANFAVCGRTDSGKTTVLRALGQYFDPDERVMIGETSFELAFPHLPNCINLVEVGVGDQKVLTLNQICSLIFLRNNPDRAILGETRFGEIIAAADMAESTSGGFITTMHVGGVDELRSRVPKMFMQGGMELKPEYVDTQIRTMFHFVAFFDKAYDRSRGEKPQEANSSGGRILTSLVEIGEEYRTIIRLDEDEFARTSGAVRRWIYENPVSQKRLSRLYFRGAEIIPEFEQVTEKYLYVER